MKFEQQVDYRPEKSGLNFEGLGFRVKDAG